MTLVPGIVGAVRREKVATTEIELPGSIVTATIPGHGVVEARYGGEPPPPLSTGWFRNNGGVWTYQEPIGHQRELLHDDFLHVGGKRGVSLERATNQTINDLTTYTISWETAPFENPDGYWGSGTTITVPTGADGLYVPNLSAVLTVGGSWELTFNFSVKAQGALSYKVRQTGAPSVQHNSVGAIPLAAGDTFTCEVTNFSGGSRILDSARLDLYRTDESDYGDTPWRMTTNGAVSSGAFGRISALDNAGDGVVRLTSDGTVTDDGTIALIKSADSVLISPDRAHWLSARARVSEIGSPGDGGAYFIGFQDETTFNTMHLRVDLGGTTWGVGTLTNLLGVPAVADEWVDLDMVIVGDSFVAAWANGSGPYLTSTPIASSGYRLVLFLNRDPGDPAMDLDVDYVRVCAFDQFALPAQLTPQVIEVTPG